MIHDEYEEASIRRAETLARARELAENWGRWCKWRGEDGSPLGRYPKIKHGGAERAYKPPPQWYPPNPRPPEPHDPTGLEFQTRAYIHLPEIYRRVLRVEFVIRPRLLQINSEADNITCAILARITPRVYPATVDRSLLAAMNRLKRGGNE